MFVYLALEAALQKYWFTSLLLPKQVWKMVFYLQINFVISKETGDIFQQLNMQIVSFYSNIIKVSEMKRLAFIRLGDVQCWNIINDTVSSMNCSVSNVEGKLDSFDDIYDIVFVIQLVIWIQEHGYLVFLHCWRCMFLPCTPTIFLA